MQNSLFPAELNDYGGYFKVHLATIKQWKVTYSPVDVERELEHMVDWLRANPRKAKKKHWDAFVVRWLCKAFASAQSRHVEAKRQAVVGSMAAAGRAHLSAEDIAWRKESGI